MHAERGGRRRLTVHFQGQLRRPSARRSDTTKFKAGNKLNIHGFASIEGPPDFNLDLWCHRANQVAELARATRPDCPVAGMFKHGPSPQPQPGAVPDSNPRFSWRTVIVEEVKPEPEPPQPKSACGPDSPSFSTASRQRSPFSDATDWLLDQVVAAKKNAKVLAVRNKLDVAAFFVPGTRAKLRLKPTKVGRTIHRWTQIAGRRLKAACNRVAGPVPL